MTVGGGGAARPREALAAFGLSLAAVLALYAGPLARYAPTGDELALLAASREWSAEWFTRGYSRYFLAFPEWTPPFTNFIRPVANALYWLHLRVFGERYWVQLLTVNLACHAGTTALVFWALRRVHGARRREALVPAALFFAGAPFFASQMPIFPSFALDGIAGLLCLAAVLAYAHGRRLPAAALLLLALFTKESALPVAATLVALAALWRDLPAAVAFAAALAGWVVVRLAAFRGLGGVYAVSPQLLPSFRNAARVPLGYAETNISRTGWAHPATAPIALAAAVGVGTNLLVWLGTVVHALRAPLAFVRGVLDAGAAGPAARLRVATGAAAFASFAYVAVVGGDPRFGYAGWALLCVALGAGALGRFGRAWVVVALACCVVGAGAHRRFLDAAEPDAVVRRRYVAGLVAALRQEPGPVLLVNDLGLGFTNGELVARFAGFPGTIERANAVELSGCGPEALAALSARCEGPPGAVSRVEVRVPPCAKLAFPGAALDARLREADTASRGPLRYAFPELRRSVGRGGRVSVELGQTLVVEADPPLRARCLIPRLGADGAIALVAR